MYIENGKPKNENENRKSKLKITHRNSKFGTRKPKRKTKKSEILGQSQKNGKSNRKVF